VKALPWLEYDVHLSRRPNYNDTIEVLTDLLRPFVESHRDSFRHWHFLLEVDSCRPSSCEVRLRFEGNPEELAEIKHDLITAVGDFSHRTGLVMCDDEALGSHEGCHGNRSASYQGAASEGFGRDWQSIVKILQIGSESAIHILSLGRGLVESRSLQTYQRQVQHPYFLHLPANQLIIEP
jgi:hypothetical protein